MDIDKDGRVESEEMYAWPLYHELAPAIKRQQKPRAWQSYGARLKRFRDGPHWELDRKVYPAPKKKVMPRLYLALAVLTMIAGSLACRYTRGVSQRTPSTRWLWPKHSAMRSERLNWLLEKRKNACDWKRKGPRWPAT